MPTSEPTYCVAEVRVEARDAWRDFCDRHGINRAAFAEVLGAWMASHPDLPPLVAEWVRDARDLAAVRRQRG